MCTCVCKTNQAWVFLRVERDVGLHYQQAHTMNDESRKKSCENSLPCAYSIRKFKHVVGAKVNAIRILNLDILEQKHILYLLIYINISCICYQYDLCGYFYHIFLYFHLFFGIFYIQHTNSINFVPNYMFNTNYNI